MCDCFAQFDNGKTEVCVRQPRAACNRCCIVEVLLTSHNSMHPPHPSWSHPHERRPQVACIRPVTLTQQNMHRQAYSATRAEDQAAVKCPEAQENHPVYAPPPSHTMQLGSCTGSHNPSILPTGLASPGKHTSAVAKGRNISLTHNQTSPGHDHTIKAY